MNKTVSYKAQIDGILIRRKMYRSAEFSASLLAEELGISTYKLSRVLKEEYGMAYADIVHQHRIQDAMRYLRDRRYAPYTVEDIGMIVGFCNRQSFFSAFKRVTGKTPKQYRSEGL